MMRKEFDMELKVGLFVTFGLLLIMGTILILGGTESFLTRRNTYFAKFNDVGGLIVGSKVILGGVPIGTIEEIKFDRNDRRIITTLSVKKEPSNWIREDSKAEILTQGVLGDKYISVSVGADDSPPLKSGSEIPSSTGKDISQFIDKGDSLLSTLNSISSSLERILDGFEKEDRSDRFFEGISATATNLSSLSNKWDREFDNIHLKKAVQNLAQILEKVNNGTGSIGALINDPGLYYEIKALFGGVNRNRIMRNLVRQAVHEKLSTPENEEAEKSKTPRQSQ